jgi:dTDP-4-dehydrorhamnose 3,5-epimerase
MKFVATPLKDVYLLEPTVFGDQRGFFMETWNRETFRTAGFDLDFVQDNHSRSARGILRGLHFQMEHTQGKLVRVTSGEVFRCCRGPAPELPDARAVVWRDP